MLTIQEKLVAEMVRSLSIDSRIALCISLLSHASKSLEESPAFKEVGFKQSEDPFTNALAVISIIKNEQDILDRAPKEPAA